MYARRGTHECKSVRTRRMQLHILLACPHMLALAPMHTYVPTYLPSTPASIHTPMVITMCTDNNVITIETGGSMDDYLRDSVPIEKDVEGDEIHNNNILCISVYS